MFETRHDFTDGVPIPPEEREKWMQEALARKEREDEKVFSISSGDSAVMTFWHDDGSITQWDVRVRSKRHLYPYLNPDGSKISP